MPEPSVAICDRPAGDSWGSSSKMLGALRSEYKILGPDGLPCEKCLLKGFAVSYCPHWPCVICYKDHHNRLCPYYECYPQGAPLDPCYDIICRCGNLFNQEKWVCTSCGGKVARIISKYCSICNCRRSVHATYECPEDKVAAAQYKVVRDKMCSKIPKLIPYIPKSSYVPTPPPGQTMKEENSEGSETLKKSSCGVAAAEHSKHNQFQVSSSSETMPIPQIACNYSASILHDDGIPIAFEKIAI